MEHWFPVAMMANRSLTQNTAIVISDFNHGRRNHKFSFMLFLFNSTVVASNQTRQDHTQTEWSSATVKWMLAERVE